MSGRLSRLLSWRFVCLVLFVLAVVSFVVNVATTDVRSSNLFGLTYGWSAFALLLLLGCFGLRRRFLGLATRLRLGSAASWLRLHLNGGLLFGLLVLLHSGFRVPIGVLTLSVWILSLWVVVSGLVGLLLQRWVPRALTSGLSIEVLWERIPDLVEELRERAASIAENCDETLLFLYRNKVEPALVGAEAHWIYCIDVSGGVRGELGDFHYLRRAIAHDQKPLLDALEVCYRTKIEIDAHYTLQSLLRYWLVAHTPPSIALLVLVMVHIGVSLVY